VSTSSVRHCLPPASHPYLSQRITTAPTTRPTASRTTACCHCGARPPSRSWRAAPSAAPASTTTTTTSSSDRPRR